MVVFLLCLPTWICSSSVCKREKGDQIKEISFLSYMYLSLYFSLGKRAMLLGADKGGDAALPFPCLL